MVKGKDVKILVVDDEQGMRDLLTYELTSHGYEVKTASNGMDALELIRLEKFNVVISDVKMPAMNGLALLEKIKLLYPEIEVIMTTGHGTIENAVSSMKMGAYDFILKPFNLEELVHLVQKALEKVELKTIVALYEASKAVFSVTQLDELIKIVMDLVQKVIQADEASLMLLNNEGKLYMAASRGIPVEASNPIELSIGERVAGMIAQKKEGMLLIRGLEKYPEFKGLESNPRVRSSIVCPLLHRNQLLGVLNLNRTNPNKPDFTALDLQSASIFNSQVALAVQNAKLYESLNRRILELKDAYRVLEETQNQLLQSEKLASIGRLVAGVAHEINNPLTAVIGYTQLLLETDGNDLKKNLNIIYDQAQRCGKIVQNLLVFARHRKSVSTQPMNARTILEETVNGFALELEKKKIKLGRNYQVSDIFVAGDSNQIKQVFSNILINAAQALDEVSGEREIKIDLFIESGRLKIRFSDNGPGIPEENRNKIFDPFFTTKEVGKGTGLGLSLSYGILQEHGGLISLGGRDDGKKGAVFTIELPTCPAPVEANHATALLDARMGEGKTVLLVEDEESIRLFMAKILEDRGYKVNHAGDGETAFQKISDESYDLIICDYRLPKMNGWQLFERVRKIKPKTASKFLFVSGSITFNNSTEKNLKQNNLPYLAKPFTVDQILTTINGIFEKAA